MKSPVYGGNAGDVNLRGRKYMMMRCRCCWMIDFRDIEADRLARREIAEAMTDREVRQEIHEDLHRDLFGDAWMSQWDDRFYEEYWLEYQEAA